MKAKPGVPARVRIFFEILEPVSLGLSYAATLGFVAFMVKTIGWLPSLWNVAALAMAYSLGRFTAQVKWMHGMEHRADRVEQAAARIQQAVDLSSGPLFPAGATCTHPKMRCPSNCGKACGHWYCPDCGRFWDDGAEQ